LLGESFKGKVDVTNSYAVPFEEDPKNNMIWYLDHNYHEEMHQMFKKVNAKEKVLGWYSTGPKIRAADLEINELIRRYTNEPVLCIIDVNPEDALEIPVKSYVSLENAPEKKSKSTRSFHYIPSEVGAYEAEEVGVEHLLRNIRDTSTSTVADEVNRRLATLKGALVVSPLFTLFFSAALKKRMGEMSQYLDNVISGKMPANNQIIYNMQVPPPLLLGLLLTHYHAGHVQLPARPEARRAGQGLRGQAKRQHARGLPVISDPVDHRLA
jgi:26S proteasome regulatory subunit N8